MKSKEEKKIKYLSLNQIVDDGDYPFSMGQMRSFLINRKKNGLDKASRKIGRRLYLREDLFNEWIDRGGKNEK